MLDWLLSKEQSLQDKADTLHQEAEALRKVANELATLRIESGGNYCDWCGRHTDHGVLGMGAHFMYCDKCAPYVEAMLPEEDEYAFDLCSDE